MTVRGGLCLVHVAQGHGSPSKDLLVEKQSPVNFGYLYSETVISLGALYLMSILRIAVSSLGLRIRSPIYMLLGRLKITCIMLATFGGLTRNQNWNGTL